MALEGSNQRPLNGALREGRRGRTLLSVCPFILGCELCERLAFYGLATNLVTYLGKMGMTTIQAAIGVSIFSGSCYFFPLFGGILADSLWGRYRTILYSCIVYLLGIILLTLSAYVKELHPPDDQRMNAYQAVTLVLSLLLVAVGTGGIKPNVSSFGADQFDEVDPQDRKDKQSFFNWFYLSINVGSLVAITVIVYIQVHVSWGLGFLIPGIAMCMALIIFVLGKNKYKHIPPARSPVVRVANVIVAALTHRGREAERQDTEQRYEDAQAPLLGRSQTNNESRGEQHWLDIAVEPGLFTNSQVDEVKLVVGVVPVFLTTILYWAVFSQIFTFFIQQGSVMNRYIGRFVFPAASLAVFDIVSLIVLIPLYDRVIVPLMERFWRRPTVLEKIGWGYVFAIIAMGISSLVEHVRLAKFKHGDILPGGEAKSGKYGAIVDMSVWWQIFQYVSLGVSEVLASIGQLEFFYDQAPDVMRSCMLALQLLGMGLGGYAAGFLIWLINSITNAAADNEWVPADLNKGRLDLMYLTMGGIMALDTIAFVFVALRYKYKEIQHIPVHPPSGAVVITDSAAGGRHQAEEASASEEASSLEDTDRYNAYGRSITARPGTPNLLPELR